MFAISFDLVVEDTRKNHPVSVRQAYKDVRSTLEQFGFEWIQGSVYTSDDESMTNLFATIQALQILPGLPLPFVISGLSEWKIGAISPR